MISFFFVFFIYSSMSSSCQVSGEEKSNTAAGVYVSILSSFLKNHMFSKLSPKVHPNQHSLVFFSLLLYINAIIILSSLKITKQINNTNSVLAFFFKSQMINFQQFLILFLISQLASDGIKAESIDQPAPPNYKHKSLNVPLILFVTFLSLFIFTAFLLYIYYCGANICKDGRTRNTGTNTIMLKTTLEGLNREDFKAFPIIVYSEFKDLKMGKAEIECAVCLNEFKEQDNLRLLPKCDHGFHMDCIDSWLACHETCPVCRAKQKPCQDEAAIAIPIVESNTNQQLEEESSITRADGLPSRWNNTTNCDV